MDGLTEGRMVHYVMPDGQHRPAAVVRVWDPAQVSYPPGVVNLQVMLDGTNDLTSLMALVGQVVGDAGEYAREICQRGLLWRTSVHHDPTGEKPGTWHWPERA